jgi:hypothetical protein
MATWLSLFERNMPADNIGQNLLPFLSGQEAVALRQVCPLIRAAVNGERARKRWFELPCLALSRPHFTPEVIEHVTACPLHFFNLLPIHLTLSAALAAQHVPASMHISRLTVQGDWCNATSSLQRLLLSPSLTASLRHFSTNRLLLSEAREALVQSHGSTLTSLSVQFEHRDPFQHASALTAQHAAVWWGRNMCRFTALTTLALVGGERNNVEWDCINSWIESTSMLDVPFLTQLHTLHLSHTKCQLELIQQLQRYSPLHTLVLGDCNFAVVTTHQWPTITAAALDLLHHLTLDYHSRPLLFALTQPEQQSSRLQTVVAHVLLGFPADMAELCEWVQQILALRPALHITVELTGQVISQEQQAAITQLTAMQQQSDHLTVKGP